MILAPHHRRHVHVDIVEDHAGKQFGMRAHATAALTRASSASSNRAGARPNRPKSKAAINGAGSTCGSTGSLVPIRASSDMPIITLITGGSELDKVLSLQAGSDDCLVKPYGVRELCARIDAVMRRARKAVLADTTKVMSNGSLRIDPKSREVRVLDQVIRTTRKEFDLLLMLASQPGTVFSRKELMARVWKDEWASGRTVDTHVSMLRNKLGSGNWIATVRGIGYRFDTIKR